jgi:hypothetical protein
MTGGGSIYCPEVLRVTHGFELHRGTGSSTEGVNRPGPSNMEINFSRNDTFHSTELQLANCSLSTAKSNPPPGGRLFNTMDDSGTGALNGLPATITFQLADAGESGTQADSADFLIEQNGTKVLECHDTLKGGNHRAHRATGSKQ